MKKIINGQEIVNTIIIKSTGQKVHLTKEGREEWDRMTKQERKDFIRQVRLSA